MQGAVSWSAHCRATADLLLARSRLHSAVFTEFQDWSADSAVDVVGWTVRLAAAGHSVPAAVAAARSVGFNLQSAAADEARAREGTLV